MLILLHLIKVVYLNESFNLYRYFLMKKNRDENHIQVSTIYWILDEDNCYLSQGFIHFNQSEQRDFYKTTPIASWAESIRFWFRNDPADIWLNRPFPQCVHWTLQTILLSYLLKIKSSNTSVNPDRSKRIRIQSVHRVQKYGPI